jgi:hypothetical protein
MERESVTVGTAAPRFRKYVRDLIRRDDFA